MVCRLGARRPWTLCSLGNPVLGAHRITGARPFHSLNLLTPGTVISASQNGMSCSYKVVGSHVDFVGTAAAANAGAADVLDQTPQFGSDHRLTLFACSLPNSLPTSTTYRLVVNLVQMRACPDSTFLLPDLSDEGAEQGVQLVGGLDG